MPRFRLALCLAGIITANSASAKLELQLATEQPEVGKPLELHLETDQMQASPPELSHLPASLHWLDTQRITVSRYTTGEKKTWLRWVIRLRPEQGGELTVPSLSVAGENTEPLNLYVSQAETYHSKPSADQRTRLSVTAGKELFYAGEQVLITIELLAPQAMLAVADILAPDLTGINLRPLTAPQLSQIDTGNETYQRLHQLYALTTLNSGDIQLPGFIIQGEDSTGEAVQLKTQPIQLTVLPPAFSSQRGLWLPAQALTLTETWDHASELTPNSYILRTLTLQATGLPAASLPRLTPLAQVANADTALIDLKLNDKVSAEGVIGQRTELIRITPKSAGSLQITAIDLPWWDVNADQARNAALPATTMAISHPVTEAQASDTTMSATPTADKTQPNMSHLLIWLLAVISIASSLALIYTLHRAKTKKITDTLEPGPDTPEPPSSEPISPPGAVTNTAYAASDQPITPRRPISTIQSAEARAFDGLLNACDQNDAQAARYSLLNWSQLFWQTSPPQSLEEIGLRSKNQALNLMIMELEQILYSGRSQRWQGQRLKDGLSRLRQQGTAD
ncbi:hypothetical protein ACFVYJ_00090 [Pontibacter sp. JAM-7]|uniref:BatD family protein n=1 Tax=Pontibacter sp. JAM-7 TaxID=3366581 RepID=UPI003AF91551